MLGSACIGAGDPAAAPPAVPRQHHAGIGAQPKAGQGAAGAKEDRVRHLLPFVILLTGGLQTCSMQHCRLPLLCVRHPLTAHVSLDAATLVLGSLP